MNKPISFLASLLVVLLTSCDPSDNREDSQVTDAQFAENFGPSVSRDFIGQIVDQGNNAIIGATVTIGSMSVQTDANGIFIINSADVNEKFAYIRASKSGYIDGSRSLAPTSGKNNIKIMLIPSTPIATINSGETADVDLPNGTKVTFDGAFMTEDGGNYSGSVSVSMFHLETSNENIATLMPGMLYAKGDDNEPKVLETFGMLNVELRGSAGQKLNIADGHKAEISMKIDDSQTATAPQSIPLWHFDEAVGYWKQEGSATRQGNKYVGEVSHFSWWNCDVAINTVNLKATVVSSYQASHDTLANAKVKLVRANGAMSGMAYTDSNGNISGPVPANEVLTLKVYDLCGGEVYSENIGPFTADTVLSDIIVADNIQLVSVTGNLVNCSGADVSNGYVTLWYGGKVMYSPTNGGHFNFDILTCGSTTNFTVEGVDYQNQQTTSALNMSLSGAATNELTLVACASVTEYATYQIDDNPPQIFLNNVTKQGGSNANGTLLINTPNFNEGVYVTGLSESFLSPDFGINFTNMNANEHYGTYTITGNFFQPGEWRDFYFTGFYTENGIQHDLTITIHSNH